MKIALITTLPDLIENSRIEEEAKNLGHEFKLFDLTSFSFSIIKSELKSEVFEEVSNYDIVIIRGIFQAIKVISTLTNSLRAKGVKVFDNNFLEHKYSIDKVTDIAKLSLAGIPVPDTFYTREFNEYKTNADIVGFPVIIKSTRMGKGANVFKIDSKEELNKFIIKAEREDREAKNFIMQEYVPYKYDLRALTIGDEVFCMRRIPAEGEFRANFSLGGSVELFDLDEEGRQLAVKALKSVGMSIGGVDILITEDNKRCILEVNHTAGFVGMEKATGKNIGKIFIEHAIKEAK